MIIFDLTETNRCEAQQFDIDDTVNVAYFRDDAAAENRRQDVQTLCIC